MLGNAANFGIRRVSTLSDDDPDRASRSRGRRSESPGSPERAIPDAADSIAGWKHLAASDLPPDLQLRDAAPSVSGSHVFLVGGLTKDGPTTGTARADLAPRAPFFQLGLFYIVVPAMGIQGEVGQQLSYLAAAGVATGDFVLLLLIGYAFNHKEIGRAHV